MDTHRPPALFMEGVKDGSLGSVCDVVEGLSKDERSEACEEGEEMGAPGVQAMLPPHREPEEDPDTPIEDHVDDEAQVRKAEQ